MPDRALNLLRLLAVLPVALALGACPRNEKPATAIEGECRIFVAPTRPVQGKTSADQFWIDVNIERGVGGCGWPRPSASARPGAPAR